MSKLYAVDERGNPVLEQLLEPFCSSLLPALVATAEEIEIRASFSSNLVEMLYLKAGQIWLLAPARNFQPFIVSGRIRMLAGLSASTQHKKQYGTIRIFALTVYSTLIWRSMSGTTQNRFVLNPPGLRTRTPGERAFKEFES